MGVERTVLFTTILVPVILLLAATVAVPQRAKVLAAYRPALITVLVGAVLAVAYAVGFTISVERGAHKVRMQSGGAPDAVRECPAYHAHGSDKVCVLQRSSDTRVDGPGGAQTFDLSPDVFGDAPNARVIANDLVVSRAEGIRTKGAASELARATRIACCEANASPHTALSTMCPRSDLMRCDAK